MLSDQMAADEGLYDFLDDWSDEEQDYVPPTGVETRETKCRQDSVESLLSCPRSPAPPVPMSPEPQILPKPKLIKPPPPAKPNLPPPPKPKPVVTVEKQQSDSNLNHTKSDHRRNISLPVGVKEVESTSSVRDRAKLLERVMNKESPAENCALVVNAHKVSTVSLPRSSPPARPPKCPKKLSLPCQSRAAPGHDGVAQSNSAPLIPRKPSPPAPPETTATALAREATSQSKMEKGPKRRSVGKVLPLVRPKVPVTEDLSPLHKKPWFHGEINRDEAEKRLAAIAVNGSFLVRKHHGCPDRPYVLSLTVNGKMYHIQVRQKPNGHLSAGIQDKPDEEEFESVESLVHYYRDHDLYLLSRGSPNLLSCATILTVPARSC